MRESPVNPIGRAVLTRFSAPKTIRPVAPVIWISMSRRLLNIKWVDFPSVLKLHWCNRHATA